MKRHRWERSLLATSLAFGGVVAAAGWSGAQDEPGPGPEPRPRPKAERRFEEGEAMIKGRVEVLLKNRHDDVDGLQLDDGTKVHFPPHIGEKIVDWIKAGDQVEVRGRKEARPRGEVVFEASRIESGGKSITVDRPGPPPPPPPPPPPGAPKAKRGPEEPMNASGTVKEYAKNPRGDVDGLVLDDGTVVKVPPHQGRELQGLVGPGDRVRVEGHRHETPRGEVHLHADRVVAVESGKALDREGPADRKPRPPEGGPAPREEERSPSSAELLRELREIRRLLEELD